MQVVIIEDDPVFRKLLAESLTKFPNLEIIGSYSEGMEFISQIDRIQPDILFLDIGLPSISGLEIAELIRRDYPFMEIIFITAYENHFKEAFELYATDYICKPLDLDRLYKTLSRIEERVSTSKVKVELNVEDGVEILDQEQIYMIESNFKKTNVYTASTSFICLYSLKELENILDKSIFFRTSRSNIVNLKWVDAIKEESRSVYRILFRGKDIKAYLRKSKYEEFRRRLKALSILKEN